MDKKMLAVYGITDRAWLKDGQTLASAVEAAIAGGTTCIQLREKALKGEELKALALSVKAVCNKYKVPFIINDDVKLAHEIDADGVHVGQSDMAVCQAREILGPNKIVGATAKTVEQALRAQEEGADYLGSGAIFGTTTKLDAKPMTKELLNEICDSVSIPVVAIGGIDADNVASLKDCNIAGVAVVSGIFACNNTYSGATSIRNNLFGKPVIQCITNHVTVNDVANIILASGGSPIMAHNINEVEEVQGFSAGLLVNLGATDDYDAIKLAYKKAVELGHPIVIDPVGVGGISFRRSFLSELLEIGTPTCIKGNLGEITAILMDENTMTGLDTEVGDNSLIPQLLAKKLGCIVVATGKEDVICFNDESIVVEGGSKMQKLITGCGCMLSGLICTLLANVNKPSTAIVEYACRLMKGAAYKADGELSLDEGTMSFCKKMIDNIYLSCN